MKPLNTLGSFWKVIIIMQLRVFAQNTFTAASHTPKVSVPRVIIFLLRFSIFRSQNILKWENKILKKVVCASARSVITFHPALTFCKGSCSGAKTSFSFYFVWSIKLYTMLLLLTSKRKMAIGLLIPRLNCPQSASIYTLIIFFIKQA